MNRSVIALVEEILSDAYRSGASDVHIDPTKDSLRIRFRIDGLLEDHPSLPKDLSPPIISRLKVLAGLRMDEHQSAQDGRLYFQMKGERVDIRVSIIPTYYGENAVLRLLHGREATRSLSALGFNDKNIEIINAALQKTSGLILVAGPTGSGKTTTLYSLIEILRREQISIITIEDPIEYAIEGIEQIQVNERSSLNFSNGLRAILRQDPDIIMVGEIRDRETAAIAINSALTGHLILSTIHTNDAMAAIPRLIDMGIEPYLIASTLSLVVGQRLVRKSFGDGNFNGRLVISEALCLNDRLREGIMRRSSRTEMETWAKENGFIDIKRDGEEKATAGLTTAAEVLRVTNL